MDRPGLKCVCAKLRNQDFIIFSESVFGKMNQNQADLEPYSVQLRQLE